MCAQSVREPDITKVQSGRGVRFKEGNRIATKEGWRRTDDPVKLYHVQIKDEFPKKGKKGKITRVQFGAQT